MASSKLNAGDQFKFLRKHELLYRKGFILACKTDRRSNPGARLDRTGINVMRDAKMSKIFQGNGMINFDQPLF